MMPADTADDPLAAALLQRDRDALAAAALEVAALPRTVFALRSENLVGLDALKRFAAGTADEIANLADSATMDPELPKLGTLVVSAPGADTVEVPLQAGDDVAVLSPLGRVAAAFEYLVWGGGQ